MKEDNASISNMEKRYTLFYLAPRKSKRISIFTKKNYGICRQRLRIRKQRKKTRKNMRSFTKKTGKWMSFWTHLTRYDPHRSQSWLSFRRTSLKCWNRQPKCWKYPISCPLDHRLISVVGIKLKIPSRRRRRSMKLDLIICVRLKILKRELMTYSFF